jgi:hypothetical protein
VKIRLVGGWFDGDTRILRESDEHPVMIPGQLVVLTESVPTNRDVRIFIAEGGRFLTDVSTMRSTYRLGAIGPDGVVEARFVSEEKITAGGS